MKNNNIKNYDFIKLNCHIRYNKVCIFVTDQNDNIIYKNKIDKMLSISKSQEIFDILVRNLLRKFKHKKIELYITGKFSGQMIYTMQNAGLEIIKIEDITPIPANGCRPPKLRTKKLVKIK